ncbi:GntR family transcriptional regulator [Arthrobacter sp. SA17]
MVTQLRHAIVASEIPPGTHLVESQVSASFGVSRGPIRDAFRQLEAEGLVESRRRGSLPWASAPPMLRSSMSCGNFSKSRP